jgi:hypothetical protein
LANTVQHLHVGLIQENCTFPSVLDKVFAALRARDRHYVAAFAHQPGEVELAWTAAPVSGHTSQGVQRSVIAWKVVARESCDIAARVVLEKD